MTIHVAKHVCYDDSEAKLSSIVLSDDRNDGSGTITLTGGKMIEDSTDEEYYVKLLFCIHDAALANRIHNIQNHRDKIDSDVKKKLLKLYGKYVHENDTTHEKQSDAMNQRREIDKRLLQSVTESRDAAKETIDSVIQTLQSKDGSISAKQIFKEKYEHHEDTRKDTSAKVMDLFHQRMRIDSNETQRLQDLSSQRSSRQDQYASRLRELCKCREVFVVAHPHGRKKYISAGEYISAKREDFGVEGAYGPGAQVSGSGEDRMKRHTRSVDRVGANGVCSSELGAGPAEVRKMSANLLDSSYSAPSSYSSFPSSPSSSSPSSSSPSSSSSSSSGVDQMGVGGTFKDGLDETDELKVKYRAATCPGSRVVLYYS